ncbi:MAG: hypothetical protein V4650_07700 [Pseudomonadota bacterium]
MSDTANMPHKPSSLRRKVKVLMDMGYRISGAALQVLTTAVVAKALPAEQAGKYFLGFTIAMVLSVSLRAGFDQSLTRFCSGLLANNDARGAGAVANYFLSRFVKRAALFLMSAALIGGPLLLIPSMASWFDFRLGIQVLPFLASVPLLGVGALAGCFFQAAGKSLSSVTLMFYVTNFSVIASALLLPSEMRSDLALSAAFFAAALLTGMAGFLVLRRQRRSPGFTAPNASTRTALDASASENAVTVICNLALLWGPLLLLGAFSSSVEAAQYNVASRIAQVVAFVLPALNFAAAPRFAALRATGRASELQKALLLSVGASTLLSSLVAIPMILGADSVMGLMGEAYAGSSSVLTLLIIAQWINGGSGPVIQFLSMVGLEKTLRKFFVVSGVLVLVLGITLSREYGANGAAIASLTSLLILNILCLGASFSEARRLARNPQTNQLPSGH